MVVQDAVKYERHGLSRSPEYRAWRHIIDRCENPSCSSYADYGARGISICLEWRRSFAKFLQDVGKRPSASLTIDRIDNNRNYEPGNVRWADRTVQMINTRPHRNTVSGVRGVTWHTKKRLWHVRIQQYKHTRHVGYFQTIRDAKIARQRAEKELGWV